MISVLVCCGTALALLRSSLFLFKNILSLCCLGFCLRCLYICGVVDQVVVNSAHVENLLCGILAVGRDHLRRVLEVVHNSELIFLFICRRKVLLCLDRLIVEQLIEGPQELGHYATIPSDVKLLNVSVNDSVCSINLDAAFLNSTLDVAAYIPIYSIVDSLAELSTVSRVQIRINGSQDDVFRDQIPLSTVLERNYDYIVGGKND